MGKGRRVDKDGELQGEHLVLIAVSDFRLAVSFIDPFDEIVIFRLKFIQHFLQVCTIFSKSRCLLYLRFELVELRRLVLQLLFSFVAVCEHPFGSLRHTLNAQF